MKITLREAERMCLRVNGLLAKLLLKIDEFSNPHAANEFSDGIRAVRAELRQEMTWIFIKGQPQEIVSFECFRFF